MPRQSPRGGESFTACRRLYCLDQISIHVSTAENGKLALERSRHYQPDILVVDLEIPLLSGMEVTRELRKPGPTPAVVICSVESDPEVIEAAQQAGALGYVFKMQNFKFSRQQGDKLPQNGGVVVSNYNLQHHSTPFSSFQ